MSSSSDESSSDEGGGFQAFPTNMLKYRSGKIKTSTYQKPEDESNPDVVEYKVYQRNMMKMKVLRSLRIHYKENKVVVAELDDADEPVHDIAVATIGGIEPVEGEKQCFRILLINDPTVVQLWVKKDGQFSTVVRELREFANLHDDDE